ncbi:MAG: UDP-GlcNAc--UDP-phosphate GlcNAc-1-phosphate transferase, partial [Bacteroidales bacterium]|nr:UDP-GlcNAc--UDP-phosphate GlcNAc-1-phosphate transferase [Bacteroidales bacterium]
MFVPYLLITLLLLGLLLMYFRVARRFNIIDHPGGRTSHVRPTIRGGGILFPAAALIWYLLFGMQNTWAVTGLLLISAVSFFDDAVGVRAEIRLVIHIVAVSMLLHEIGLWSYYWYWIALAFVLTAACINAFNFMDGINGITSFYTLVTLGSFSLLNNANRLLSPFFDGHLPEGWVSFLPGRLVGAVFVAVLVFSFFNARKRALTFAGDVGSISIAFLMSWFMIALMNMSHSFYWILLFSVYGIDTAVTICVRIRRKENLFRPHRLHLYQLLANERGMPHLRVAALFAITQLLVNLGVIVLIFSGNMTLAVFLAILFLL